MLRACKAGQGLVQQPWASPQVPSSLHPLLYTAAKQQCADWLTDVMDRLQTEVGGRF